MKNFLGLLILIMIGLLIFNACTKQKGGSLSGAMQGVQVPIQSPAFDRDIDELRRIANTVGNTNFAQAKILTESGLNLISKTIIDMVPGGMQAPDRVNKDITGVPEIIRNISKADTAEEAAIYTKSGVYLEISALKNLERSLNVNIPGMDQRFYNTRLLASGLNGENYQLQTSTIFKELSDIMNDMYSVIH